MKTNIKNIRNFAIIAHIDHGKSTFCDRLIQICNALNKRDMKEQMLDTMDLERERGITIKSQSMTLKYCDNNNKIYKLNIIDTPGHVDFSYEVSRSLSACEGALLIIDSTQGIEAQTIANFNAAVKQGIKIIPVLNKVDLAGNNIIELKNNIKEMLKVSNIAIPKCSAKTGVGIKNVLTEVIETIPCPSGNINSDLEALIIDSWFDKYFGVVSLIRVINGEIKKNDKIKLLSNNQIYKIQKIGVFTPHTKNINQISAGCIGFIIAGIKNINSAPVGDTITHENIYNIKPIKGFKKITPKIFSGLFPVDPNKFTLLKHALNKLSLNDSSISFIPEVSKAMGSGFRCGFLGLLHMDIIQERLEREYSITTITSSPTVTYKVILKNKKEMIIDNPSDLPKNILLIQELIVKAFIITNKKTVGAVMNLCIEKRGKVINTNFTENYVLLTYKIPLMEIISDFFDKLKSTSNGYASLDYKILNFENTKVSLLVIMINHKPIDALASFVHDSNILRQAKKIVNRLTEIIPKQMFEITIQACANNKRILFKKSIKALRKNVIDKCYGGDVSRKKKLLKKQNIGKKRMKQVGKVVIPQEAFFIM